MSKFRSESFLFRYWSESQISIRKTPKINFDRARSTTINLLLRALRAICNISSSDEGEDLFADELLVY